MPQTFAPQVNLLLIYAVVIIVAAIVVWLFLGPLRWLALIAWNTLLGGAALFVLDFLGQYVGFHIGLNVASAMVAGLLGIPGVALLLVLRAMVT